MFRKKNLKYLIVNIVLLLYQEKECEGKFSYSSSLTPQLSSRFKRDDKVETTTKSVSTKDKDATSSIAMNQNTSTIDSNVKNISTVGYTSESYSISISGKDAAASLKPANLSDEMLTLIEMRESNGKQIDNITLYPYIVSISIKTNLEPDVLCTGVLVNTTHVLTSATCASSASSVEDLLIRLGSVQSNEGGVIHNVKKITVHPEYSNEKFNLNRTLYNIALLEMDTPVVLENGIQLAHISKSDDPTGDKTEDLVAREASCKSVDFGVTSLHGNRAGILREFNLSLVSWRICNESLMNICAVKPAILNKTSCSDDGEVLICNGKVYGIFARNIFNSKCENRSETYIRLDKMESFIFENGIGSFAEQAAKMASTYLPVNFIPNQERRKTFVATTLKTVMSKKQGKVTDKVDKSSTNNTMDSAVTSKMINPPSNLARMNEKGSLRKPFCEQIRRPPPGVDMPVCPDSAIGCCPEDCYLSGRGSWRRSKTEGTAGAPRSEYNRHLTIAVLFFSFEAIVQLVLTQ